MWLILLDKSGRRSHRKYGDYIVTFSFEVHFSADIHKRQHRTPDNANYWNMKITDICSLKAHLLYLVYFSLVYTDVLCLLL